MFPIVTRRFRHIATARLIVITILLQPLSLSAADFRGRSVSVTNYGAAVTMGVRNPVVGSHASFQMLGSLNYAPEHRHIQTGWSRQPACGTNSSVFVEVYNPPDNPGGYNNRCNLATPAGDADYYHEYDGSTGYWCHGYQGTCIESRTAASGVGFASATNFAVFGETSDRAAEMGGPSQAQAIWLTNVNYKPTSTSGSWNAATQSLGSLSYGSCPGTCPYGYQWGYAANTLYTNNWTN